MAATYAGSKIIPMTAYLVSALKVARKSPLLTATSIALVCPVAFAQGYPVPATAIAAPPSSTHSFDVATIKPFHPGPGTFMGIMNTPDGLRLSNANLAMLVVYAYGLRTDNQVAGGPDWTKTERFDVQAKMGAEDIANLQKLSFAEGTARRAPMMQALLADRFKLQAHAETKQVPVYELVVAKGASKLQDTATDPDPPLGKGEDGKPSSGIRWLKDTSLVQAYSMSSLAGFLSQPVAGVGRPVLDKTGLTGTYDFKLNWSVYSARPAMPSAAAADPAQSDDSTSIFSALKELGLKLQPATGPIETIIIDHVERPLAD
jgi:uncharacterized protein (TIGR03435 family)